MLAWTALLLAVLFGAAGAAKPSRSTAVGTLLITLGWSAAVVAFGSAGGPLSAVDWSAADAVSLVVDGVLVIAGLTLALWAAARGMRSRGKANFGAVWGGAPAGSVAVRTVALSALLALAALGPHAGLTLASAALVMLVIAPGRGAARAAVLGAAGLLALHSLWLLDAIAGPIGLQFSSFGEIPLSPAAEIRLSGELLLAALLAVGASWSTRERFSTLLVMVPVTLIARVAAPLGGVSMQGWWGLFGAGLCLLAVAAAAKRDLHVLVAATSALAALAGAGAGATAMAAAGSLLLVTPTAARSLRAVGGGMLVVGVWFAMPATMQSMLTFALTSWLAAVWTLRPRRAARDDGDILIKYDEPLPDRR